MRPTLMFIAAVLAASSVAAQQDSLPPPDVFPVILVQRLPAFPFASWQNHTSGTVVVRYVIDTSGAADPATFELVSSPDSFMARAVRKAIHASRFRPGFAGGRSTPVRVEQAFVFDQPRGDASTAGLQQVGAEELNQALRAQSPETAPVPLFTPPPPVPPGLRVTGTLFVQFIIDTAGRVEPASVKVLNSSDDRVTDAVVAAILRWRFRPATIHGRPLRLLVKQPFTFGASHSP